MKVIIEYEFEEQDDARVALDGYKWKIWAMDMDKMWELDQTLRSGKQPQLSMECST
jgi:hypothetical protein